MVNEKQLIHADSAKHHQDDIALTPEEFKRLPAMLEQPEAVLLERNGQGDLLLIYPAEDGRKIKLVVRSGFNLKKQRQPLDVLVNAFKVPAQTLGNAGMYEQLEGE